MPRGRPVSYMELELPMPPRSIIDGQVNRYWIAFIVVVRRGHMATSPIIIKCGDIGELASMLGHEAC